MTADRPDWGEARSRLVTWHDPSVPAAATRDLTGLEFLRAIQSGTLPPPPIAKLANMTLLEVEPGRVVFGCEPDESLYNPIGMVHGGIACTMCDSATGCAVHTTLGPGVGYTSIDLHVSYLRPVTLETGRIRAVGRVTKPGRRVAFAEAELIDEQGKLLATATSSCLVIGPPGS